MNGLPPSDNINAEVILNSFVITEMEEYRHGNIKVKTSPNPFQTGCIIEIQSDFPKDLKIDILDIRGNFIRKIFTGKIAATQTRIVWDGITEYGKSAPPGLYLIYLRYTTDTRYFKIVKW